MPHHLNKPWTHVPKSQVNGYSGVQPKVELGPVLIQARASGVLNVSNRGLGPFLPETISQLHNTTSEDERIWENVDLRSFDMSLNSIEELPNSIGNEDNGFPFLTKLICRNNLLTNLPESISNLSLLVILDISNNRLTSLLPSFQSLKSLVDLKCENNQLSWIPQELCFLPRLANLNLDKNKLTHLPECIGRLSVLQTLTCAKNELQSIPSSLGQINSLQTLVLSHNQINLIPLLYCKQLKTFDVRENNLSNEIVFSFLNELQQVFLSFNPLSKANLILFQNNPSSSSSTLSSSLSSSSSSSSSYPSLPKHHILSHSSLLSSQIVELHLSNSSLISLPQDIGLLALLQTLDISNNDLTDLPCSIGYLGQLVRCLVDGNPIKRIRRSLIQGPTSELKTYLRTRGPPHPLLTQNKLTDPKGQTSSGDVYSAEDSSEFFLSQLLREAASTNTLKISPHILINSESSNNVNRYSSKLKNSVVSNSSSSLTPILKTPSDVLRILENLDTYMSRSESEFLVQPQLFGTGNHRHHDIFGTPSDGSRGVENDEQVVFPACQCLTKLDLSYNSLSSSLPSQLGDKCLKLKELNFSHNKLLACWDTNLTPFKHLISIDASHNLLTEMTLNNSFKRYHSSSLLSSKLKYLNLRNNQISGFPISLFHLVQLHTLLLGCNQLRRSLENIEESYWCIFSQLETLDLSSNELRSVGSLPFAAPRSMARIKSLDLSNNELRTIPPELGLLTSLNALIIHGNPQRAVRQHTIDKGTPDVLAALLKQLKVDEQSANEFTSSKQSLQEHSNQHQQQQYQQPSLRLQQQQYQQPSPRLQQQQYQQPSPRLQQQLYQQPSPRLQQQQYQQPSPRLQQQQYQQPQQPSRRPRAATASCMTCGSQHRLEADADNPEDVYCERCWNEWASSN